MTATEHAAKPYNTVHGVETMVSGTRMKNFCVVNQHTFAQRQPEAIADEAEELSVDHLKIISDGATFH